MSIAHRHYFNELAPEWTARMPDDPKFRELLIQYGIAEGDRVLDAGAGTGRMTRYLVELVGAEGLVVAQDFAFQMIHEGKVQITNPKIGWVCDDLCRLGLISGFFDKVLCFSIFPHLQDPSSALQEIHRVLKPGGRMLILHTDNSDNLNAFHASLSGVVRHDRLPASQQMKELLISSQFYPVCIYEEEGLYWVEGEKARG